ncbi:doubled CXXCH motif [bacterium BMS3Bbin06]|nr:doubled CXXCH motif [bacterium BMS3Bbin06]
MPCPEISGRRGGSFFGLLFLNSARLQVYFLQLQKHLVFKELLIMKTNRFIVIVSALGIGFSLTIALAAYGGSVVGSKHDLSSSSTPEVCVFCHTPHFASTTINAPLWNRKIGPVTFTPYQSPTMDTACASPPSGVSLACLGCHDGVNSDNDKHDLLNAPGSGGIPDTTSYPNCARCHPTIYGYPDNSYIWLGVDLSDDHPISMPYPTPAQDPQFNTPPDAQKGWGGISPTDVKLYSGKVECPSCHNVHDPDVSPFLRKSNAGSVLCTTCHIK